MVQNEPINEHVIRGPHEGFVEAFDTNLSLIRKRLAIPDLVARSMRIGQDSNTRVNYVYIESIADAKCGCRCKKKTGKH